MPLCRSTKLVFTTRLTLDNANAASIASNVPNTTVVLTRTTRPFSLCLCTVAYVTSDGNSRYGLRGRPGFPVRGGVTTRP